MCTTFSANGQRLTDYPFN